MFDLVLPLYVCRAVSDKYDSDVMILGGMCQHVHGCRHIVCIELPSGFVTFFSGLIEVMVDIGGKLCILHGHRHRMRSV